MLMEQHQFGQEQVQKVERERDQVRDMLQRVSSEKDRLAEQFKERLADQDARLKKLESDKQRSDIEHSRVIRDKDGTID